jgi:hypothetical protein
MRLGSTPGSLKFFCWSSIFAWGICMALFWMAWRARRALWPLGAFQYQFFH